MADNSVFTELIDVSLDVEAFSKSLDAIIAAYDQKLGELSQRGIGPDAINASGALNGATSQISELANALNVLTETFLSNWNSMTQAVSGTTEKVTETVSEAAKETDAQWKASLQDQLESLADIASQSQTTYEQFTSAVFAAADAGVNFGRLTRETQLEAFKVIEAGGQSAFTELTAQQQQWFTDFAQGLERIKTASEQWNAELIAQERDAVAERESMREEELARLKADIQERASMESQWANEVVAQERRIAAEREAVRQQELATLRNDIKQRMEAEVDAETEITEARIRFAQERNAAENRANAEQRSRELSLLRQDIEQRSAVGPGGLAGFAAQFRAGFAGGADKGIMEELPQMLGAVTRFQVLWGLVGLAMHAVEAVAQGIVDAFKNGWQYLTDMESKAAALQGVLAGTVSFSTDLAQNFKLSGEAAEALAKKLQDVAIQSGLSEKQLTNAFKSFMEAGGANYVQNLNQAVQVTQMLGLAMKAAGKDEQGTRALIAQIPQLLDGSIGKHSQLLEVLHLTQDQWEKIRESAIKHRDLVSELAPRLQPYLTVVEQAEMRQEVLNEQMKLMTQRSEALVAEPMWKRWTALLQEARNWFLEHKNEVDAILSTVGHLIASTYDFVAALIKAVANNDLMKLGFQAIAVLIQAIVESANVLLNLVTGVLNILGQTINVLTNPQTWLRGKDAFKELWDYAKQQVADYGSKAMQSVARISDAMNNTANSNANKSEGEDLLNAFFRPTTPVIDNRKTDNSALTALEAQYTQELKLIKDGEAAKLKEIDEAEAARRLSVKQAADERIASHSREANAVIALANQYRNLLSTIPAKAGSKQKFDTRLSGDANAAAIAEYGADKQEQAKVDKDEEARQKSHNAFMLQLARDLAAAELAIYKQEAQEGYHTKLEVFDKEVALEKTAHEQRIAALTQEAVAAGANALAFQNALQKIVLENEQYTNKTKENEKIREALLTSEANKQKLHESTMAHLKYNAAVQDAKNAQQHAETSQQIRKSNADLAKSYLALINSDLAVAEAELAQAKAMKMSVDTINQKAEAVERLKVAQKEAQGAAAEAQSANGMGAFMSDIFGPNVKNLKDAFKDFDTSVHSLSNAFDKFKGAVGNIINGFKQGGTAGGIGSIMSTAGGFLSNLPGVGGVIGGVMSFAGGIMSSISGLFTAAARHIAETIKKEFDQTMKDYQNGVLNLKDTIAKVEQERQEAIDKLSHKKGGQDQLKQLLPQLDDQITQLKAQQKQVITNFDAELGQLRLQSDTLATTLKTWQDINKQVKDYLDAGGDAAKAAEYLSLNLQKLKQDALDNMNQGEADALNMALQLNDLLQQRIDLEKQFATQQFDLLNGDALERRATNAVSVGIQLQQQRAAYQKQLDDLNSQIDLTTKKLDLEKQVYSIASDTAALKRRSAELELDALNEQIAKLKDYASIYAGIYQKPDGSYGLGQDFSTQIGAINVTVNGVDTTTQTPAQIGAGIAGGLHDELNRQLRYGKRQQASS